MPMFSGSFQDQKTTGLWPNFTTFQLESGYDYLQIGSGLNAGDRTSQLVKLSGSSLPDEVVSINNEMWLNFTSDDSVRRDGFWIEIIVFRQDNITGN